MLELNTIKRSRWRRKAESNQREVALVQARGNESWKPSNHHRRATVTGRSVRNLLHTALHDWWIIRNKKRESRQELRTDGFSHLGPQMLEPWTHPGISGENCCWRQVIYGLNGFKLMWKLCQNRNMQIAARNGNLKIAGADEGRNMLINELKSDCISQVVAPQGKHIERRQNGASLSDRSLHSQKMEYKCRGEARPTRTLGSIVTGNT